METLDVIDTFKNTNDELKNNFLDSLDSKMEVKIDYEKKEIDYSWIDLLYENVIYIDNILRNPKKFIINEEEIVKVELAKKVTVESIIHLTQHTNLIQDFDQKTNDVTPSKILNINKEESLDTYENRFIYTLIKQIDTFVNQHENDIVNGSYCYDEKEIKYNAGTKLDNEDIKISLSLSSNNKEKNINVSYEDVKAKLKKIKMEIANFMNSELMISLTKLHVSQVRPPIRKTNVILKNPNFQKAEQLWNFFMSYDKYNFTLQKDNKEYIENGILKQQFDESFLLNYLAMNSLSKNEKKVSYEKTVTMSLNKVIEMLLDNNELDKKRFNEIINEEYSSANEKIKNRDKIILSTFEEKFDKIDELIKEACLILN
ncbi:MAG: DUF2357 domain-containing protein [Bacilli bacterium]|nr:DUF2357 domain-containing protein [Bacilli bacterium]